MELIFWGFFFFFWPCHAACGVPVPQPGTKPPGSSGKSQDGIFLKLTVLFFKFYFTCLLLPVLGLGDPGSSIHSTGPLAALVFFFFF